MSSEILYREQADAREEYEREFERCRKAGKDSPLLLVLLEKKNRTAEAFRAHLKRSEEHNQTG